MSRELALVPRYLESRGDVRFEKIAAVGLAVVCMSLLARLAIPLPWTPVPITGQTFGVALTALLWGRRLASMSILIYLGLGAAGLPVLAMGTAGIGFGPTTGYLVGMVFAAAWMGELSDRGWTRSFWRCYLAAASGSAITFACGVFVLSFFVPSGALLSAGVYPFLPGDLIKTLLACGIAVGTSRARP